MAGEHLEKTAGASVSGGARGAARAKTSLTTPQAEEVLGVARLNGVHRAVLDAHNGQFGAQRHGGGRAAGGCRRRGGGRGGGGEGGNGG